MYQKIMVPLDGSPLAECVFPHVEALARGCSVKGVVFVRVVDPINIPPAYLAGAIGTETEKIEAEMRSDAEKYLQQLLGRIRYDGVSLQAKVLEGRAADSLAEYAEKNGVDLIVIATHGRSGVSRWAWGGVADRILRSACVPVLMVRAPGCVPGI